MRMASMVFLLVACSPDPVEETDAGTDADVEPTDAGTEAGADAGFDAGEEDAGFPRLGDSCTDAVDANAFGSTGTDGILRIRANNDGGRDDHEFCDRFVATTHVADLVFAWTAPADGQLRWTLDFVDAPTRFDVDVRTTCDDVATSTDCARCDSGCDRAHGEVSADEVIYFIVAGVLTTGNPEGIGEFEIAFDFTPYLLDGEACDPSSSSVGCAPGLDCQDEAGATLCGTCGDGFRDFDLFACDDGNTTDGDGCSSRCEPDDQPAGGAVCDVETALTLIPVYVSPTDDLLYATSSGSMTTGSDVGATCATGDGPEALYSFTLAASADVEVSARGADAVSLRAAGAGCSGTEVACQPGITTGITLMAPGLVAGTYVVIVDRNATTSAADAMYSVEVAAIPL